MSITTKTEKDLRAERTPGSARPRVLVLLPTYLPGYLAGGPIRSIANMVDALGDEFEFRIVTSDRDHKARTPYDGSRSNACGKRFTSGSPRC
jgi:hypothetical protein